MFGLGKIAFGILLGLFVIPAVILDPAGTFETASNIISKIIDFGGAIGEVSNV